ncbi:MAG: hypothetical protein RIQ41_242 [Candidatus Parcubacteria bacterium]
MCAFKDLLFPVVVTAVIICILPYPAFTSTLIATIVFTTISCVYWGHAPTDFPGTGTVLYCALSTGMYFAGFSALHFLYWQGKIAFEVEWLALSVVALLATSATLVICFVINRPK